MSDAMSKDECCNGCLQWKESYSSYPCNVCNRVWSGMQKDWFTENKPGAIVYTNAAKDMPIKVDWDKLKASTKEKYLTKLIDDHWGYISKLIDVTQMHSNPKEKAIAEFHYRSAAAHFWKHAFEYMEENKDE